MIAGRLTMRAAVERNYVTGRDGWGQPLPPVYEPLATMRCFVWSKTSREIVDGDKSALVEDMRAMFARSADIREHDEIADVRDARGNIIIPGRLSVEGPAQHKHTHIEVALKRIG